MSRLKEARSYLGLTQQQLAESIGQKWYKIKDIETEKNKMSVDIADSLRVKYSISFDWLLTGKGKMLINMVDQLEEAKQGLTGSNDELADYLDSKNSQPKITAKLADEEPQQSIPSNLVEITYYEDVVASAGGGAYNTDEAPTLMAFDKNFLKVHLGLSSYNNIHIITATGDSMEPTISAGEFLFISPIENEGSYIKEGGIYIIMCEDSILVKRVSKNNISKEITLISDNTVYPAQTIKLNDFDNCKILGRVIGHFNGL